MGPDYQAGEISLRYERIETFLFVLEGRADGIVDRRGRSDWRGSKGPSVIWRN